MRKILTVIFILCSATLISLIISVKSTEFLNDELLQFRRMQMYNGVMYVTPRSGDVGVYFGDGNVTTKVIPCDHNQNDIYSFAIYNDKIYYISALPASDIVAAKLYECDLNGDNVVELADNPNNYSNVFISHGEIYYDTVDFFDDDRDVETKYRMDGIYKVNIKSRAVTKVVNKPMSKLGLVDDKNIFYSADEFNYYCNLDGSGDALSAERDDRCGTLTVNGYVGIPGMDTVYYNDDGDVYEFGLNTYNEGVFVASIDKNAQLCGIDKDNLYYTIIKRNGINYTAYVYSIPINNTGNDDITVKLNGKLLDFDQPPIIFDDRTLVPLRVIFEALGADVSWNGNTQTVTAAKNGIVITVKIGEECIYKNSEAIAIDVPAMIVNERTLVPVRAVSEALGADVSWDGNIRQVIISSDN